MLTRESQYEDLKILHISSGYVTDDEANCGYDDYIYAVRKKWLLDYMSAVADHAITEEWLNDWLLNDYTSEDSYDIYKEAKADKEIVFEGPVYQNKPVRRCVYRVRDELRYDGNYEDEVYLQTTYKDEALERFEREVAKIKKKIEAGEFFLQEVNGEISTRSTDGLPTLNFDDGEGEYYCLYVEREEYSDWRK